MQQIKYISHNEIDKAKWDNCVQQSANGLIYAYSWYLDTMAENWDALVLGDYETIMPLTWNKKYGVYYLYQPYFCASLGIFSKKEIKPATTELFLKSISKRFRYIDIYLNHSNLFSIDGFPLTERVNYILPLNKPYNEIAEQYRTNLKRNIKKAEQGNLKVVKNISLDEIITLAKETMQRVSAISDEQLNRFKTVFAKAKDQQLAETLGIYDSNDQLLASAAFLFSHKRWYYILVGNHPNGKTLGASHYLIDRFIAAHSNTDAILDFEGSDIRNLAFFYSSYGATEERYPALRMNRLPKLLKWLKE